MYVGMGNTALGASRIPWWCWESKGFKECHGDAYRGAQSWCQATGNEGYADTKTCIEKEADLRAFLNCKCSDSPPFKFGSISDTALLWGGIGLAVIAGYLTLRKKKKA